MMNAAGNLWVFSHLLALLAGKCWSAVAFQAPLPALQKAKQEVRPHSSSTRLFREPSKWDKILDDDDDDEGEEALLPAPPDMKYVERNVMRQHQNFVSIRDAGGKEVTNDVYVPEPNSEVFWFAGKIARVSDISVEQAIARQWPLIEQHAANLRPIELYPSRGHLEIWVAPGDTELEVGYNRPEIKFTKMEKDVEGAANIKSNLIGFQGEVYEKGAGMGFRTSRKRDGSPANPEIQTPDAPAAVGDVDDTEFSDQTYRTPTDEELKKLQEALKDQNMDISELYQQQQNREGTTD